MTAPMHLQEQMTWEKRLYDAFLLSLQLIQNCLFGCQFLQGLQILLMSGVSVTSASQILESFWNIWSQVSDFPARGPGMYTLS